MLSKIKSWICIALLTAASLTIGSLSDRSGGLAGEDQAISVHAEEVTEQEERGLVTNLILYIEGGDGEIRAWVKNQFTLFPSTIVVYLELYSSETYQESYTTMTLEKRVMTGDLNMGDTLETSAPTNGEQKYWKARMRYKFDERDWISKETEAMLYNGQGELVN